MPSLSTAFTNISPSNVAVSVYPEATVVQLAPPSFEYMNSLIPIPATVVPPQLLSSVAEKDTTTLEAVQLFPSYGLPFTLISTEVIEGGVMSLTVTFVMAESLA